MPCALVCKEPCPPPCACSSHGHSLLLASPLFFPTSPPPPPPPTLSQTSTHPPALTLSSHSFRGASTDEVQWPLPRLLSPQALLLQPGSGPSAPALDSKGRLTYPAHRSCGCHQPDVSAELRTWDLLDARRISVKEVHEWPKKGLRVKFMLPVLGPVLDTKWNRKGRASQCRKSPRSHSV